MHNNLLHHLLTLVCALAPLSATAATETVIHSFSSFPRGANPYAPLWRSAGGDLYGTTNQGGQMNLGVVFKLSASGQQSVLRSFTGGADGANPYAGVLIASSGDIYGTTYAGGPANAGVIYHIDPAGHESVLYAFTGGADGGNPYAGLIADSAGYMYGTTYKGGVSNAGVVYKVAPSGQETVLYAFTGGSDGGSPYAGVIMDPAGNLYGTTLLGGMLGPYYYGGVVYKLDPTGHETVLYTFNAQCRTCPQSPYSGVIRDSAGNLYGATGGSIYKLDTGGNLTVLWTFNLQGPNAPEGDLVRDSAGNIYGTAEYGAKANLGGVFKLDTTGKLHTLYSFPGAGAGTVKGGRNAGVVLDSLGNVYGTTPYGGTMGMVYKVSPSHQETTLYSFSAASGGTNPSSGVTLDPAGNLYGTTQFGGGSDMGVVYKLDAAGRETTLYSFKGGADGAYAGSNPVLDAAGNVYGTTSHGGIASGSSGYGVVYKIDPAGHETVLYTFTGGADGGLPNGVILDPAGNLYGTTFGGGIGGAGVVYKLDPSGTETVLYRFTGGTDGASPTAGVVPDAAGNLYGTTFYGGTGFGFGVVYKIDTSNKQTVLHSFSGGTGGGNPNAGVILDPEGNLFGTTLNGGGVYMLTPTGQYTVLYAFKGGSDGSLPEGGVARDSAGNLYGTTSSGGLPGCGLGGCGLVFKVDAAGQETVLYSFTGGADGASPWAGVTLDSSRNLYGTTPMGGKGASTSVLDSGAGIVYKISR